MYSIQHLQASRRNVDQHIGDLIDPDMLDPTSESGMDRFYEEVYTIAHDGAVKAGATMEEARKIAQVVRGEY